MGRSSESGGKDGQKAAKIATLEREAIAVVKEIYESEGLTYEQYAAKSGIARATLHKSLIGIRATTVSELDAMASALGMRLSDVIKQAELRLAADAAAQDYIAVADVKLRATLASDFEPAAHPPIGEDERLGENE